MLSYNIKLCKLCHSHLYCRTYNYDHVMPFMLIFCAVYYITMSSYAIHTHTIDHYYHGHVMPYAILLISFTFYMSLISLTVMPPIFTTFIFYYDHVLPFMLIFCAVYCITMSSYAIHTYTYTIDHYYNGHLMPYQRFHSHSICLLYP